MLYIIRIVPETKIEREWIQNEILHCLQVLQVLGFKVRGVVCDDHSSNVSAFKKLFAIYGPSDDDLAIEYNNQKVYLFFDVVHLMKNIRNNLLNRKRFLFPSFSLSEFYDAVKVSGGEVSRHALHRVYERDQKLQANNMRANPKLCLKVLHPESCKQSAPLLWPFSTQQLQQQLNTTSPIRQTLQNFKILYSHGGLSPILRLVFLQLIV